MTKSSNVTIIENHYAASTTGDIKGALALLSDDAEWTEMDGFPYAGTYIGAQAVMDNVFQRLGTEWSNYKVQIDQLVDGGNVVVALGYYEGTYRKTGKFFRAAVAHVWILKSDKIVKFVQYTDTLRVAEAMH